MTDTIEVSFKSVFSEEEMSDTGKLALKRFEQRGFCADGLWPVSGHICTTGGYENHRLTGCVPKLNRIDHELHPEIRLVWIFAKTIAFCSFGSEYKLFSE